MGEDRWTHREPGSATGSVVPPPISLTSLRLFGRRCHAASQRPAGISVRPMPTG
jgi:hypothetical protein